MRQQWFKSTLGLHLMAKTKTSNNQLIESIKEKELKAAGWTELEFNLWTHKNRKAYGYGMYLTKDAYKLLLDFKKRGVAHEICE